MSPSVLPSAGFVRFRTTYPIMAITKVKKGEVVAKIGEVIKDATSVVFVHFKGLSVEDTSAMRRTLKAEGVGYLVAKKTLIRHALAAKGFKGEIPELPGEIALAWSAGDPTVPARDIYEHGKKHKGALTIVGGIFEDSYQDAVAMNSIATIPPLPVLRGMFVNVLNSPIQGLVIALDQVREKKVA
jgi:large subunit ribosomal protein L10